MESHIEKIDYTQSNDGDHAHQRIESRKGKVEELVESKVNGLYGMFLKDQVLQNHDEGLKLQFEEETNDVHDDADQNA